jgi:hypothetical protein
MQAQVCSLSIVGAVCCVPAVHLNLTMSLAVVRQSLYSKQFRLVNYVSLRFWSRNALFDMCVTMCSKLLCHGLSGLPAAMSLSLRSHENYFLIDFEAFHF